MSKLVKNSIENSQVVDKVVLESYLKKLYLSTFVVKKLREGFSEGEPRALVIVAEKAPDYQVQLDPIPHTRQIVWVTQILGM